MDERDLLTERFEANLGTAVLNRIGELASATGNQADGPLVSPLRTARARAAEPAEIIGTGRVGHRTESALFGLSGFSRGWSPLAVLGRVLAERLASGQWVPGALAAWAEPGKSATRSPPTKGAQSPSQRRR